VAERGPLLFDQPLTRESLEIDEFKRS